VTPNARKLEPEV